MPRPEDELARAFGEVLRKARQEARLSQEELAARSGLHRTYISQFERGQKSPSLTVVAGLARSLGLTASELVGAAEEALGLEG
mgnify:CR=1 FL=1